MKRIIPASILLLLMSLMVACSNDQNANLDLNLDNAVPQSLVEDLKASDTSSLTVDDCEKRLTEYGAGVDFKEESKIPANMVIKIDLDEVYLSWKNYPLVPMCIQRNYGIFATSDTLELPNSASVWAIETDA